MFLKSRSGLYESITKNQIDKSTNTTIVHLHMKIQGAKYTRNKAPYTDPSNNRKNNLVFCVKVDLIDTNKGKI